MIVVVGGFARCGSSMLMRMLRAGGIPALADDQEGGLEYHEAVELPDNHAWLAKADGMAVKVLDPHRCVVPRQYDARFILMRRNVHEQALSQEKFLRTVLPGLPVERGYAARLAKSLASDWNLVQIRTNGRPRLNMTFEGVLADPMGASLAIGHFLEQLLDFPAMAAVVRRRSPLCGNVEDVMESLRPGAGWLLGGDRG